MGDTNPLLQNFSTPHQTAPFDRITEEDFMPAFEKALEEGRSEIKAIINNPGEPTFENTIEAMEKSGKLLDRISSVFFNLNLAETNEKIQSIAREVSPMLSEYSNDIWLNEKLFERVKQVYNQHENNSQLNVEQKKLLDDTYKAFARRGASLSGSEKERYREISSKLSQLSLQFGENVLAETNDFKLHITNKDDLAGLPGDVLDAAAQRAKSDNKEGWIFTLQIPSYLPFMKYADNRDLRETMFRAFTSRGNKGNKRDNNEIIKKTVALRSERSKLLGFKNHAEYVLTERMAKTPDKVNSFLNELLEAALPFAQKDVKDVETFAKKEGFKGTLQRWDFAYYSEKLKTESFNISDEMTKPYFQLEKVKDGIFDLTNQLYGLSYKRNKEIPVYNKEVEAYEVYDNDGSFLSVLYLDFFPRDSKQGGAWMTSYLEQHKKNGKDVRPHISVVTNFTRPTSTKPSLLTYNEVNTFLHEFGHALHGMLSNVTYESMAGTSVYRDFVELPSQIMENWAQQKDWLQKVAKHYKTGEPIPGELVDKIIAAGNFQSGYATVRQLSFGMNDMAWHTIEKPVSKQVSEFENEAMQATELFPDVDGSCMSTAFGHIFDGGYAAGYYGYKWAEVLDADAFDLFKKNGIFDKETAQKFRDNILSKGGTKDPMDLYVSFRGQEPSIEPLLERSGLK
ncbi:M3 family metallopeptidase [Marinilabilia rubra]|uniref:Peptidase M3 n=1 Tax=Marinilabilia rubra TaxID=2162893 RepID=A0A2U2B4B3_9BACT|nr:M3 family metallopeptidase [Marinilabilia rubra]PWD97896.1 peptidase M3 [Marinilabilia rubra]